MIWLIGAGLMAQDYIKVLSDLNVDFICIGRSVSSAKECTEKTGKEVILGGLEKFLLANINTKCDYAIVATDVESLFENCYLLLNHGVKNILLEKPGVLYHDEFFKLYKKALDNKANVFIAYNRRFYASVLKLKQILATDGELNSFYFDFTEWSHVIEKLDKPLCIKNKWFLCNSTHVVDLAFFIGGKPKKIDCYSKQRLGWHPTSSVFCGSGITDKDVIFSYHANWNSAGRWGIEILTDKCKFILRPLEKLYMQNKGSLSVELFEGIDYSMDEKYKPGLYLQVQNFLSDNTRDFCSLLDQIEMLKYYYKIAKYSI
ncbi:gfo/Idh/MocA family oxidoreductase [Campylobacter jejuni]|nr:gfo/Idh/MocA family oxidoreductase [Campylobacter jejuni]EHD9158776.1 gfo/Idh/MocA family oxidoreductase [Campylobacter jejuni]